jgi:hypothetical protein
MHQVITTELIVSWLAMIVAAIWIVHLQRRIDQMEEVYSDAEEALEAAHEAVDAYHRILTDVALNQATLEITHEGNIVATRVADRDASRH